MSVYSLFAIKRRSWSFLFLSWWNESTIVSAVSRLKFNPQWGVGLKLEDAEDLSRLLERCVPGLVFGWGYRCMRMLQQTNVGSGKIGGRNMVWFFFENFSAGLPTKSEMKLRINCGEYK